jgi:hypothetical protein
MEADAKLVLSEQIRHSVLQVTHVLSRPLGAIAVRAPAVRR